MNESYIKSFYKNGEGRMPSSKFVNYSNEIINKFKDKVSKKDFFTLIEKKIKDEGYFLVEGIFSPNYETAIIFALNDNFGLKKAGEMINWEKQEK